MTYAKTKAFDKDLQDLAKIAKGLSHPARLAIIRYLAKCDQCISGDIANEMPLSRTTVSQHLQELKNLELISGEIDGVKVCYCLNKEKIGQVKQMVEKFFSTDLINCC